MCDPVEQQNENSSHCIDRLSNLRDEVLPHILTFLKTRTVVRTSILSRRWRHVYVKVQPLGRWSPRCQQFVEFVDQSLANFQGSKIIKFCLQFTPHDGPSMCSIYDWIDFAMSREWRNLSWIFLQWQRVTTISYICMKDFTSAFLLQSWCWISQNLIKVTASQLVLGDLNICS